MKDRGFWLRMLAFIGILLIPVVMALACGQHTPAVESEIVVEALGVSSDLPECTDILDPVPGLMECELEELLAFDESQVFFSDGLTVDFMQCIVAELDGMEPLEAVVKLDFYLAEDYHSSRIMVYSIENVCLPHLVACEVTPRPCTGTGWLEAIDINRDGVDEIVVVTDMDETGTASDPGVYVLKEGKLLNVVQGSFSIPSYFTCDLPFDSLCKSAPLKIVHERLSGHLQATVLEGSESGFYIVTEIKPSQREPVIDMSSLMQAVITDVQSGYIIAGQRFK